MVTQSPAATTIAEAVKKLDEAKAAADTEATRVKTVTDYLYRRLEEVGKEIVAILQPLCGYPIRSNPEVGLSTFSRGDGHNDTWLHDTYTPKVAYAMGKIILIACTKTGDKPLWDQPYYVHEDGRVEYSLGRGNSRCSIDKFVGEFAERVIKFLVGTPKGD